MAKANVQGNAKKGRIGQQTLYRRNGEDVLRVSDAASPSEKPTEGQMRARLVAKNPPILWNAFEDELRPTFEELRPGQTDYNRFCSLNIKLDPVYTTKEMTEAGACLLTHAQVSEGSLRPNVVLGKQGENYVSDIAIGRLVIDDQTTVAQLSTAIIEQNAPGRFQPGDNIGCFVGKQYLSVQTHNPEVIIHSSRLVLDESDETPVSQVLVLDYGFRSVGRYLGYAASSNQLGAYVQTRAWSADNNARPRCTIAYMQGDNALLARFQTEEAFETAARSYGGYRVLPMRRRKNHPLPRGTQASGGSGTGPGPDPTENEEGSGSTGGSGSGGSQGGEVTLTCSAPGGGGTVSPTETTVPVGTQVTFTATPNSGKMVRRWSTGATGNTLTVTATEDKAYTVEFTAAELE